MLYGARPLISGVTAGYDDRDKGFSFGLAVKKTFQSAEGVAGSWDPMISCQVIGWGSRRCFLSPSSHCCLTWNCRGDDDDDDVVIYRGL